MNARSVLAFPSAAEPVRVLLVDDDEDYAHYMRRILGGGIQLDVAHDLEGGRRALERRHYALVISDYDLKHGTGIDLLAHARANQGRGLRILITGNTSLVPEDVADAVHYVWDKQWDRARLETCALAAIRSASHVLH